jgi:hypothetical protein
MLGLRQRTLKKGIEGPEAKNNQRKGFKGPRQRTLKKGIEGPEAKNTQEKVFKGLRERAALDSSVTGLATWG